MSESFSPSDTACRIFSTVLKAVIVVLSSVRDPLPFVTLRFIPCLAELCLRIPEGAKNQIEVLVPRRWVAPRPQRQTTLMKSKESRFQITCPFKTPHSLKSPMTMRNTDGKKTYFLNQKLKTHHTYYPHNFRRFFSPKGQLRTCFFGLFPSTFPPCLRCRTLDLFSCSWHLWRGLEDGS